MTQHSPEHESGDLREFLGPVWSRKWLILCAVIAATAITYMLSERKPDQYTAATRLFVQPSQVDVVGGGAAPDERNTTNQATLLRTRPVARAVARSLNFRGDPSELLAATSVATETGNDFVTITSVRGTPQGAADLANAFAKSFIEVREATVRERVQQAKRLAEQRLAQVRETEATLAVRTQLQDEIDRLKTIESLPAAAAEQVERAAAPGIRSAPAPRRSALFAFAISLVLAVLAAFGLERFDRRLRRTDQIAATYRAPVLAALPHVPRADLAENGGPLQLNRVLREVVRGLRAHLQLVSIDDPIRTILVTSAVPAEGKSTLVRNLALAYEEAGSRVAIIECDLRRPTMAKLMQVNERPGLTEVLLNECDLANAVQFVQVAAPSPQPATVGGLSSGHDPTTGVLTVITSGAPPANPPKIMGADRMRKLLALARENNDMVIIDSPPLLSVADTLPLLPVVDGVVLVARVGSTDRVAGRRCREIIDQISGVELLGIVANDVPTTDLGGGAYAYGYYGYEPRKQE